MRHQRTCILPYTPASYITSREWKLAKTWRLKGKNDIKNAFPIILYMGSTGREVFVTAVAAAAGPTPSVPPKKTKRAINRLPSRLPAYETPQFFNRSLIVAFPSNTAAVIIAVLPVNSSPPPTTVIIKPVKHYMSTPNVTIDVNKRKYQMEVQRRPWESSVDQDLFLLFLDKQHQHSKQGTLLLRKFKYFFKYTPSVKKQTEANMNATQYRKYENLINGQRCFLRA